MALWYIQTHNMSLRILKDPKYVYTGWENKSQEEKKVYNELQPYFCNSIYVSLWYSISPQCVGAYLNAYAGKTFKTSKLSNGPDYVRAQISEPNLIPILKINDNSQTTSNFWACTVVYSLKTS